MRYSHIALTLLLGSAFARPVADSDDPDDGSDLGSDLDIDAYNAIPDSPNQGAPFGDSVTSSVVYDPTAVAASAIASVTIALASAAATATDVSSSRLTRREPSLGKRDDCSPDTPGNYITISTPDDSPTSFLEWPGFTSDAMSAVTPPGYVLASGYQNLQQAAQSSTYMTYISSQLTFYNVNQCAAACDEIQGCSSFNIYYERDPSVSPSYGPACPNPSSVTRIKCAFFGSALTTAEATNSGQYRSSFEIVIAGSNAYNVIAPPCLGAEGFGCSTSIGDASINAPTADKSYIRSQTFPQTQPYDPSVCAAACNEMSAYNTRHAAPGTQPNLCKFFNSYMLYKNGQNGVFTCAYYTQSYGPSFATNFGQWRGSDHYTISYSFTYSL